MSKRDEKCFSSDLLDTRETVSSLPSTADEHKDWTAKFAAPNYVWYKHYCTLVGGSQMVLMFYKKFFFWENRDRHETTLNKMICRILNVRIVEWDTPWQLVFAIDSPYTQPYPCPFLSWNKEKVVC